MTIQLSPWLHVLMAVGAYVVVALGASRIIRRSGADHGEMEDRVSRRVALIGALANLVVLSVVLLLLLFVDRREVGSLGLDASSRDVEATVLALAGMAAVTVAFLGGLHAVGHIRVQAAGRPTLAGLAGLAGILGLLVVVVLQEEVLYRGYLAVNLLPLGTAVFFLASLVLFVGVHFLTNRADAAQVSSWIMGGGALVWVYLVTGSLWVVVAVHLAIDLTNVVAFGIVGKHRLVRLEPALTGPQRAWHRALVSVLLVGLFAALYGRP